MKSIPMCRCHFDDSMWVCAPLPGSPGVITVKCGSCSRFIGRRQEKFELDRVIAREQRLDRRRNHV